MKNRNENFVKKVSSFQQEKNVNNNELMSEIRVIIQYSKVDGNVSNKKTFKVRRTKSSTIKEKNLKIYHQNNKDSTLV
jgi:hypothetical protein